MKNWKGIAASLTKHSTNGWKIVPIIDRLVAGAGSLLIYIC